MVYKTLLKNIYRVLNRISYIYRFIFQVDFKALLKDAYRVLDV